MTVTAVLFSVVLARLAGIQLLEHEHLAGLAERQHTTMTELEPSRGRIFDRNGFLLAGNRTVTGLDVYWPQVRPGDACMIDSLVGMAGEYSLVGCPVNRSGINQILARGIPCEQADSLFPELPVGVSRIDESRRVYPMDDFAACVVGRYSPSGISEGIEAQLNEFLCGTSGVRYMERSEFSELDIVDPEADNVPATDGSDIILTVDSRFQFILQEELAMAVEQGGGAWGAAVLVDPSCGDILAMASYPVRLESGALAPNHCIASYHEPGSTFKVIPLAAALEERLVERDDTFDCSRESAESRGISIGDCHRFEILTLDEVIAHSSNVGTVLFSSVIPDSMFFDYCSRFGFGSRTSIELPGETPGVLHPPSLWSGVSHANLAIGQEVTVTPLQLAMAYGAIANGGMLYEPRLVRASRENGIWREWSTFPTCRVISPETASAIRDILTLAVSEGTGTTADVTGVTVAGKTGTAERLSYGEGVYLSAFAGFVPADRPGLVLVVVIDQPDYDYRFGSTLAAPAFRRMMARILSTDPAIALAPVRPCGDALASGGIR
jgi:cell division protein FtsI/penicillin-binding protein 2